MSGFKELKPVKSFELLMVSDPQKACDLYRMIVEDLLTDPVRTDDMITDKITVNIKHRTNYDHMDPNAVGSAVQVAVYQNADSDAYVIPQKIKDFFKEYIINYVEDSK